MLANEHSKIANVKQLCKEVVADIALGRKRKPVRGKLWRRISLSAGTTQLDLSSKLKSRLGQRRPSEKSREAGRPGNSEERQPMQAALVDNNPHGDPILAERYRTAFGKNMKASSQNSTFTFLQCTIVNSILVTVPYSRSIFSVNFIILSDVTIYCVPSHQGVCVCPYKYTSC